MLGLLYNHPTPVSLNAARNNTSTPITIPITLFANNSFLYTFAMIDSGASISFIHKDLALQHQFSTACQPLSISLADGTVHNSNFATRLVLQSTPTHFETHSFQLISLGNYPVILGMDWLQKHNPCLDWITGTATLPCTSKHSYGSLSPLALATMPRTIPPFLLEPPTPAPLPNASINKSTPKTSPKPRPTKPHSASLNNISLINGATFCNLVKQKHGQHYLIDVKELAHLSTMSEVNTQDEDLDESKIPQKYFQFHSVFSKKNADTLPPHRPYDHKIPLSEGAQVPFGPVYSLSQVELKALHEYIKENLDKGFICRSESPAGAPILFVKKKDGSLRLCVDYRGLNKVTIPNCCPLPLMSESFECLAKARKFTKFDMRGAYNLLHMAEGEEWKTAFHCCYGHFEYQVMPFGLMNAPGTFQAFVNDVLREFLDDFCVVYLDDILIYSDTQEEHDAHVSKILAKLQEAGISLKLEKCEFDKSSVGFLGFIVGVDGISMDPSKVAAIQEWSTPRSVLDIQVFLGLANFYCHFVKHYSKIATPLTALLKKNAKFKWSSAAQKAFKSLKAALSSGPVLHHYDPTKPCVIEPDASDYALGGVCSQYDDEGCLHPIAFYSCKLLPAEMNYQIYDKELLAIIAAFKHW